MAETITKLIEMADGETTEDLVLLKKTEGRKEVSISFQPFLKDATEIKNKQNGNNLIKNTKTRLRERPKSASFLTPVFSHEWERTPRKSKSILNCGYQVRECNCCPCCECMSLIGSECRSASLWPYRDFCRESRTCFRFPTKPSRKTRSNPNISTLEKPYTHEFHKMKRSLKLLGFELTDFGIYPNKTHVRSTRTPEPKQPTFSTKVNYRSVSLDSLRHSVKKAWIENGFDDSHRKLLSKAAYEEWYFRKEREFWEKKQKEKVLRMKANETFRENFERKKEKSEEEFRNWLQRKKAKRKQDKENLALTQLNSTNRLKKTQEESEKAFLKWKKTKENELKKIKKLKKKEDEKRAESERQKLEKKLTAEKAFEQWKIKQEEAKKEEEKRAKKSKLKRSEEERRKREKENEISYQKWKAKKEEELKKRIQEMRKAERILREERQSQMEERMYEAEQAFEDWLEKIDSRKNTNSHFYQNNIPWIPP